MANKREEKRGTKQSRTSPSKRIEAMKQTPAELLTAACPQPRRWEGTATSAACSDKGNSICEKKLRGATKRTTSAWPEAQYGQAGEEGTTKAGPSRKARADHAERAPSDTKHDDPA